MISFAHYNEINEIMDFINREWRKGHILARDRVFFEYMYVVEGRVNFVVSKANGCIDGILGFVVYDREYNQIGLTVWKALESENGLIGMMLLKYLEKNLHCDVIASPGINIDTTETLYRYLKYDVGKMRHFYRLSPNNKYGIAGINDSEIPAVVSGGCALSEVKSIDEFDYDSIKWERNAIHKDKWYISKRYFEHPVYQYSIYEITYKHDKLFLIARAVRFDSYKCLRVVDIIGKYNLLAIATKEIDSLLKDNSFEYIDCYVTGIDESIFIDGGWKDVDNSGNIIPNYFDPFVRENIDLYYSCKPNKMVILRGDGDQDRPN